MNVNTLENTLQQVQRLTAGYDRQSPSSETLHHAASFISQVHDALAVSGSDWQKPNVELGADGTVVYLWQDGQRSLSLVVRQEGDGTWVYAPGHSYGDISGLDFTNNLSQGTATPDVFARDIWSAWVRGEAPFA